jgi:hypothetical protein
MDQRSPEWYAARCGKVTASRIGDVLARTQKGWGAPRKHYLNALVGERLTGRPSPQRIVASMERRLELEPEARTAYEFYSDNEVTEVGFIEHPTIPNAGCSPDGLIGDDGGLEIKNCDPATHNDILLTGQIDKGYIYQCDFGMACTGRKWWDFVSYEPFMPEELKLFVKRIYRDDGRIAEIDLAVIEFLAEVDHKVEQLLALTRDKSPLEVSLEKSLSLARGV